MPTIQDWWITPHGFICGDVFEDDRFENGDPIHTTQVQSISDEMVATTKSGSEYSLGRPLKSWVLMLAREKIDSLLDKIPKI